MSNKRKHLDHTQLDALIAERLSQQAAEQIETHLENCVECQQKLDGIVASESDWNKTQLHLSDSKRLQPQDWMVNQQTVAIKLSPVNDRVELESELAEDALSQYDQMALDPPTHPEMLGRIDSFEIEKVIGRGGCGVVYKAFDRELNRPVAIKVLAPHLASSGIARQRFSREARAAAAVVHPNVVPIHGVNAEPQRPYIVMTLVNGRSLDAHVRDQGQLELKDIVRIAQQIAAGLAAAHRQGLVHRDIKPANILMEQDVSRVMITDFGLALAANEAAITQTGWLAGTPHYMSPEQARGDEVDQRSDLFSLGSLIYFMATGQEPFRAEKPFAIIQKIISEEPARPKRLNPDVPKTLERIIEKLLSKSANDRFQSADELQNVLENYLAHLQNPLASPRPTIKVVRRQVDRLKPWLMLVAASIMSIALVWMAYTWKQSQKENNFRPANNSPNALANSPDQLPSNFDSKVPIAQDLEQPFLKDDAELRREIQSLRNEISRLENELDHSGSITETIEPTFSRGRIDE